jgi:hypothetical protein
MRTLTITTLILSWQILFAQQKTEVYFGVTGRTDAANDLLELYDMGYSITGGFEGSGEYNYGWNIKTDINIELVYDKVFEHSMSSVASTRSVSDSNGNIYVCGFIEISDQWPFVMKIDSCGNHVWCKILDYSDDFEYGSSRDILLTEENEVIVLTGFESELQIDKVHLIGLSTDGDVLWKKPYASQNNYSWIRNPSGYSMIEHNNEYYISGFCYWPYPDDTTHWFLRPLFIGIDSLFEEKWILPFYALDSVFGDAFKTIPINDSIMMGVGVRRAYDSSNEDNAILMFYNTDGEQISYKEIFNDQIGPEIKGSDIRNIVRINENLFMTASQFGPDFSANPYGELIIDTSANIFNLQSHPNTVSFIPGLIKTYDSNYVIATNIQEPNPAKTDIYVYKIDENLEMVPFDPTPHNYDSLCPGGIQSGNIDLTGCFIWTDIGEAPSPKEYYETIKNIPIIVYPNPSSTGQITFEFENTEHHKNMELRCFDIYGNELYEKKVYQYQEKSLINVSNWGNGLYMVIIYSDGVPVGNCKFVIQ